MIVVADNPEDFDRAVEILRAAREHAEKYRWTPVDRLEIRDGTLWFGCCGQLFGLNSDWEKAKVSSLARITAGEVAIYRGEAPPRPGAPYAAEKPPP